MLLTQKNDSSIFLEKSAERLLLFYEKGDEIPLSEPGFWQVTQGVVQLSKINAGGDDVILGWATANNSFGGLVTHETNYRAQALAQTRVRWCDPSELAKSPERARILMSQLSQRLIKAEKLLTITGMRRVRERLWQLLLILKEEMGQPVVNGTRLRIRFTHQNLAQIICTTRVTVTIILGEFQEKRLISIDNARHIIIKHQDAELLNIV